MDAPQPPEPTAQTAQPTGHGNTIVQIVGNGNAVVLGHPHLCLTRFEAQRHIAHPLNALSPYARSTRLQGREMELASLRAFLASPQPISVRVLVGGGGSGKTRLALALCDQMQAEGWNTGFATGTEMERFFTGHNLSAWGWQKPTLVVVDYAAAKTQALGPWLDELADRSTPAPHPLRILLLERNADTDCGWWHSVFGGGYRALGKQALLDPPDPVTLHPLGTGQDRMALLHNMLALASPGHPMVLPVDDPSFQQRLMQLGWGGNPLYLMMAAAAMAQLGAAQALTLGRTELARFVATQEADRLQKMARASALPEALVLHLAACTTLAQGMAEADFIPFARDEQLATGWTSAPAALAELLHQALPQADGIAPITPDVIGEAFVLLQLRGDKGTATVRRCHASLGQHMGQRVAQTTIRCVQDFADTSPEPLRWLQAIVQAVQHDAAALAALDDSLPAASLPLRDVALAVTQRRLDLLAASGNADPAPMAGALNNLAVAQSQLGQHAEALQSSQKAVDLYRRLATQQPTALEPELAVSLHNLANHQHALRQRPEAWRSAQEAVDLRRKLAARWPAVFQPKLASSLNNLSGKQSSMGLHPEALASAQEAVDLRRSLAQLQPDVYQPALATSLNNLANRQGSLDQHTAALQTIQQAVDLYRSLAAQRPDLYLPQLTSCLHNLANQHNSLGQPAAALPAVQEAVRLRRTLATQRPGVFGPDLAKSLLLQALCTHALQGPAAASALAREAVQTLRPAANHLPQAHGALLQVMLGKYADFCHAAGQQPEAELLALVSPAVPNPPH
nr:tetratricopeptide repeat protein [uncultured Albidiferax sp.]